MTKIKRKLLKCLLATSALTLTIFFKLGWFFSKLTRKNSAATFSSKEILIPIVVYFELPFSSLAKSNDSQSLEYLEVNWFKVEEGFLVQQENLPIYVSSEGESACCCPFAVDACRGEEVEENFDRGHNFEIFTQYLEARYHGPTIWMELGKGH